MSSIGGNQHLMAYLGAQALQSVDHLQTYFTVQHRHPDGLRWLDLAHFASRQDAETAMRAATSARKAEPSELRVQRVTRETS